MLFAQGKIKDRFRGLSLNKDLTEFNFIFQKMTTAQKSFKNNFELVK